MSEIEHLSGVSAHNDVGWGTAQAQSDINYDQREESYLLQTAGTAGAVQVDLDQLATFWGDLSGLHDAMQQHIDHIASQSSVIHSANAGGLVGGPQEAWTAIAQSAGALDGYASLHSNMRVIDNHVVAHMNAVAHNASQYTGSEKDTITLLGRASEGAT